MDTNVEWRPVVGWEDDYEISITGLVRRTSPGNGTRVGFIKYPRQDRKGYLYVGMPGKRCVRIHRMIAQAWIPNPDSLPLVRHLDGDPTHNHPSNLAWGTAMDNTNDRKLHGRKTGWHHLQTHCKNGHELTADNVRMCHPSNRLPYRRCKTCVAIYRQRAKIAA
jgi:hypothetical protein